MFSVIVPTMWKYAPFVEFLAKVLDHKLINQVVLIDNHKDGRPSHVKLDHEKITLLDFGRNMFVNPAWNVGAYHAHQEYLCFLNDDFVFDLCVLQQLSNCMTHAGGIYAYTSNPCVPSGQLTIIPHTDQLPEGFGQLFFLHRKNFVDIPESLLVHCGDYYLWDCVKKKHGTNHLICNLDSHTPHSVTSQLFVHMYAQACVDYESIRQERGLSDSSTTGKLYGRCQGWLPKWS